MASDNDASCESDPNFAVICGFLEKFGVTCGLTNIDFLDLQEMLENTQEVRQELVELHVKLLRKARKSVSSERWERAIIKLCHTYCSQDAWEIERFGYKKARIASKLRILKELLEMQFDFNAKFKNEVNKLSAEELRTQPLGRDRLGHAYWYQSDDSCQVRVYKEDPDEETWSLVARDRSGLVSLIAQLNSNDSAPSSEPVTNEDSNSLEVEKPIIDTGQTESDSSKPDDTGQTEPDSTKPNDTEQTESNSTKPDEEPEVLNSNIDSEKVASQYDQLKNVLRQECDSENQEDVKLQNQPEENESSSEIRHDVQLSNESAVELPKSNLSITKITSAVKKQSVKENNCEENSDDGGMDLTMNKSLNVSEPHPPIKILRLKPITELMAQPILETKRSEFTGIKEKYIRSDLSTDTNRVSLNVPVLHRKAVRSAGFDASDLRKNDLKRAIEEEVLEEPTNLKRPRLDRPTLLGNKKIRKSYSEEDEVEDEITEPVMYFRGEGSGYNNQSDNTETLLRIVENPIIGEEIEEDVVYFYGIGSGLECETGNQDSLTKQETNSEMSRKTTESLSNGSLLLDSSTSGCSSVITESTVQSNKPDEVTNSISSASTSENDPGIEHVNNAHDGKTRLVKHEIKLGIIIDIKTDETRILPKSPLKKSRWDVGRPTEENSLQVKSLDQIDVDTSELNVLCAEIKYRSKLKNNEKKLPSSGTENELDSQNDKAGSVTPHVLQSEVQSENKIDALVESETSPSLDNKTGPYCDKETVNDLSLSYNPSLHLHMAQEMNRSAQNQVHIEQNVCEDMREESKSQNEINLNSVPTKSVFFFGPGCVTFKSAVNEPNILKEFNNKMEGVDTRSPTIPDTLCFRKVIASKNDSLSNTKSECPQPSTSQENVKIVKEKDGRCLEKNEHNSDIPTLDCDISDSNSMNENLTVSVLLSPTQVLTVHCDSSERNTCDLQEKYVEGKTAPLEVDVMEEMETATKEIKVKIHVTDIADENKAPLKVDIMEEMENATKDSKVKINVLDIAEVNKTENTGNQQDPKEIKELDLPVETIEKVTEVEELLGVKESSKSGGFSLDKETEAKIHDHALEIVTLTNTTEEVSKLKNVGTEMVIEELASNADRGMVMEELASNVDRGMVIEELASNVKEEVMVVIRNEKLDVTDNVILKDAQEVHKVSVTFESPHGLVEEIQVEDIKEFDVINNDANGTINDKKTIVIMPEKAEERTELNLTDDVKSEVVQEVDAIEIADSFINKPDTKKIKEPEINEIINDKDIRDNVQETENKSFGGSKCTNTTVDTKIELDVHEEDNLRSQNIPYTITKVPNEEVNEERIVTGDNNVVIKDNVVEDENVGLHKLETEKQEHSLNENVMHEVETEQVGNSTSMVNQSEEESDKLKTALPKEMNIVEQSEVIITQSEQAHNKITVEEQEESVEKNSYEVQENRHEFDAEMKDKLAEEIVGVKAKSSTFSEVSSGEEYEDVSDGIDNHEELSEEDGECIKENLAVEHVSESKFSETVEQEMETVICKQSNSELIEREEENVFTEHLTESKIDVKQPHLTEEPSKHSESVSVEGVKENLYTEHLRESKLNETIICKQSNSELIEREEENLSTEHLTESKIDETVKQPNNELIEGERNKLQMQNEDVLCNKILDDADNANESCTKAEDVNVLERTEDSNTCKLHNDTAVNANTDDEQSVKEQELHSHTGNFSASKLETDQSFIKDKAEISPLTNELLLGKNNDAENLNASKPSEMKTNSNNIIKESTMDCVITLSDSDSKELGESRIRIANSKQEKTNVIDLTQDTSLELERKEKLVESINEANKETTILKDNSVSSTTDLSSFCEKNNDNNFTDLEKKLKYFSKQNDKKVADQLVEERVLTEMTSESMNAGGENSSDIPQPNGGNELTMSKISGKDGNIEGKSTDKNVSQKSADSCTKNLRNRKKISENKSTLCETVQEEKLISLPKCDLEAEDKVAAPVTRSKRVLPMRTSQFKGSKKDNSKKPKHTLECKTKTVKVAPGGKAKVAKKKVQHSESTEVGSKCKSKQQDSNVGRKELRSKFKAPEDIISKILVVKVNKSPITESAILEQKLLGRDNSSNVRSDPSVDKIETRVQDIAVKKIKGEDTANIVGNRKTRSKKEEMKNNVDVIVEKSEHGVDSEGSKRILRKNSKGKGEKLGEEINQTVVPRKVNLRSTASIKSPSDVCLTTANLEDKPILGILEKGDAENIKSSNKPNVSKSKDTKSKRDKGKAVASKSSASDLVDFESLIESNVLNTKDLQVTSDKDKKSDIELSSCRVLRSRRSMPVEEPRCVEKKLPLLTVVSLSKLTGKSEPKVLTELKSDSKSYSSGGSPQSILSVGDDSSDVIIIPETDPLSGIGDMELKNKDVPVTLASFKLDSTDIIPLPINRVTRNRAAQQKIVISREGRKRGRDTPLKDDDPEESGDAKRPKMRGKRAVDVDLRRSIEEQKRLEVSSTDDENNVDHMPVILGSICDNKDAMKRISSKKMKGRNRKFVQKRITVSSAPSSDVPSESTDRTDTTNTPPVSKRATPKPRTKTLLGLDIPSDKNMEEDLSGSVRQSRRIAQIKIKEEAERRKIEEIALLDSKEEHRKRKVKKNQDKDYKAEKRKKTKVLPTDDDTTRDVESDEKKKHKRKRKHKDPRKIFDEHNPWKSSSDSSSSAAEEEEEEIEPSEDEGPLFKSDHEFSPESDIGESEEMQPMKRARTARKECDNEEEIDDCACQRCDKTDHPEWILLCDKCDSGWHCSCLRPPLLVIPEGDWFCPPCQHTSLVQNIEVQLIEFDKKVSKRDIEERRKERLAYVGISLANVLPIKEAGENQKSRQLGLREESDSEDSESSSASGSNSGSDSSEPIYQLRQRRQAHSYRFNDYDDLINSAIQDEVEAVKGAGNQGRGKDISTIVNAEREESLAKQQNSAEKVELEPLPSVVPRNRDAEPFTERLPDAGDGNEEMLRPMKKRILSRKKHRRLNSLDVSSGDDAESDEDFKGTSSDSEEEDFDEMGAESSDELDARRGKRRKDFGPVRRSTRARVSRYDREFINDDTDDDEAPRRKKTRPEWDESESEESDRSWGRRKRKSGRPRKHSLFPKLKKSKKKKKILDDSDPEVYKSKKKPKIKFGGLDNEQEEMGRKTRGKKINYLEALGTDSDDEVVKRAPPRIIESEEEYVLNEDELREELEREENYEKDEIPVVATDTDAAANVLKPTEEVNFDSSVDNTSKSPAVDSNVSASVNTDINLAENASASTVPGEAAPIVDPMVNTLADRSAKELPNAVPVLPPQRITNSVPMIVQPKPTRGRGRGRGRGVGRPRKLRYIPEFLPKPAPLTSNDLESHFTADDLELNPIEEINKNIEEMNETDMEKLMEEEEYANKQLQLVALQIEKEKKRKEREAKRLEKLAQKEQRIPKKRGRKPKNPQFIPGIQNTMLSRMPSLLLNSDLPNNAELSEPPGVTLPLFSEMSPLLNLDGSAKKRRGRGKGKKTLAAEQAAAAAATVTSSGKDNVESASSESAFPGGTEGISSGSNTVSPAPDSPMYGGKLGIAAPPQPFAQTQPTPSVITRMLQTQPAHTNFPTNSKFFAGPPVSMVQPSMSPSNSSAPPVTNQYMSGSPRGMLPGIYRPSPPGMNHFSGARGGLTPPQQMRTPGPQGMLPMYHSHPLDPSPSGGGPINVSITNRDRNSPALVPNAQGSPLSSKGDPTPPPPPYSRSPMTRYPSGILPEVVAGTAALPSRPLQMIPQHLQQPRGNSMSPYHPGVIPNYHFTSYPPPQLGSGDEALPPTAYQSSPYSESFAESGHPLQPSDSSNSKTFEEEAGGEFGGLVSYFSSQREDDLDT